MSKNLTRKGIAFGALVALGTSIFAAAPAHAIDPVSLDPTAGTSYSTILGEQFSLTSLFSSAAQLGTENLKFLVTDTNAVLATNGVKVNSGSFANEPTLDTNKQFVVDTTNHAPAPSSNTLILKAGGSTTASVTVQAFLDYNGNGKLDSGESASAVRTVTWVAPASVTATTAITGPIAGDTSAVAKISFDGLNNEQINEAHVAASFTKGDGTSYYSAVITGVDATTVSGTNTYATSSNNLANGDVVTVSGFTQAGNNVTGVVANRSASSFDIVVAGGTTTTHAATATATRVQSVAAWSATNKFAVTATVPSLVAAQAVKVQPLYLASGTPAVTNTIGSAATASVAATSVNTIAGSIAASNVSGSGATANVAIDSAYTVNLVAKDATTPTNLPVAGKTVTYTVAVGGTTTNWFSSAAAYAASSSTTKATLTVNGVTYTNSADLAAATLSGVTDASGNIAVTIAQKNLVAGATVTVTPAVEHATATPAVATTVAATYTANLTSGAFTSIAAGGTSTASVLVVDQFGKPVADGYDARAQITSSRTTTNATGSVFAPLSAGKATLTFVDNGVGTGTNSYSIDIVKRDAVTGSYGSALTGTSAVTALVNIKAAADLVPGTVVLGSPAALIDSAVAGKYADTGSINTGTFGAYDPAAVLGTNPSLSGGNQITGTVSSASTATYVGVAVSGAQVTIASAGAQFKDNVTGRYATDSITVAANNSGVFDVQVWSHKSGDVTYTVTSGAASVTDVITYAAPANTTGASVVITAPTTALPGTTIKVTVSVVDKFGNAIADITGSNTASNPSFKLAVAGIGAGLSETTYGASGTVNLTAGTVTKYIVLGASDQGTLTVTGTYDADGTGTTAAVSKVATVVVGAPAATAATVTASLPQAQVGSAVDIAVATGVAGVTVTFTNAGTAYLSAASAVTDAKGNASVKLVGNVAGLNTVTATANGAAAKTATVAFGQSDANLTASGKTVTAAWNFAGGKKVVVAVNGKTVKKIIASDDTADSYTFKLAKGTNKVTVSVAGVVTDSLTVKVKK